MGKESIGHFWWVYLCSKKHMNFGVKMVKDSNGQTFDIKLNTAEVILSVFCSRLIKLNWHDL